MSSAAAEHRNHSQRGSELHETFRHLAQHASHNVGTPWAFALALGLVLVWLVTGPLFHFSDSWQLVINTGTTIVTFLMVFLIQNTQNRDAHAVHLKLDELIRSNRVARKQLLCLEDLTDDELDDLQHEFERIAQSTVERRKGHSKRHMHTAEK